MSPRAHAYFRDMSPGAIFTACFSILSLAEVGGNVTALIAFNYWMRSFQYGSATVTVNFLCAVFYVVMFVPLAISSAARYVSTSRHGRAEALRRVRVFLRPRQLGNAFLIALSDSWIDIASTYAAGHTTVLTQVFAKSAEPLITFVLTRLVLREVRNRAPTRALRALPGVGFLFVGLGVVCHMWERLAAAKHNEAATAFFIGLYLSGVVGSSCYAITQSRFIRGATEDFEAFDAPPQPLPADDVANTINNSSSNDSSSGSDGAAVAAAAALVPASLDGAELEEESEEADGPEVPRQLIRSMALAMDTSMTLVITLLVVPWLDTIPHFGSSASYRDVWTNLHEGFRCVATCPDNFGYAVLTTGGWGLVYLADTFMNHFSPTLNSMVNEFTAPVGVIAMFIHPAWALSGPPSGTARSVALDVASVVALVIGVAAFARYELLCSRHLSVLMPAKVVWAAPAAASTVATDDSEARAVLFAGEEGVHSASGGSGGSDDRSVSLAEQPLLVGNTN